MTARRVGQPRRTRRLEHPVGRFQLRAGLKSPGAISLVNALALVVADWQRQIDAGTIGAQVIANYRAALATLLNYARALGIMRLSGLHPALVIEWIYAPRADGKPAAKRSASARLSAARAFLDTCICLGLIDVNVARSVHMARSNIRFVAPLSDAQVTQLQDVAPYRLGETKAPAALALLLIGATSREAAYVRVGEVDLGRRRVWLHEGGDRVRDRWVTINDTWAFNAIEARIGFLRKSISSGAELANTPLVYEPRKGADDPGNRQAAVAMTITKLMRAARIYTPGSNRVESIREYVAVREFNKKASLVDVALRLGMSSLDMVAHIVGFNGLDQGINDPAPELPAAGGVQ